MAVVGGPTVDIFKPHTRETRARETTSAPRGYVTRIHVEYELCKVLEIPVSTIPRPVSRSVPAVWRWTGRVKTKATQVWSCVCDILT